MFIKTLYIDSKDRLWIGSEAGLFLYHSESNTITSYNKSTSPTLPQSTEGILCIYEDQHHLLWVGTSGEGLFKYDIKTDSFASAAPLPILFSGGSCFFISSV
jgi:ligand-binding sensor domain-containing protein